MKKIVKTLPILLIFTFVISLTGCQSKNVEGSLEEILEKIYQDIPSDEMPMLGNIDVDKDMADNIEYYIGTKDIEYKDILASEPMMSSVAYSVVLVRMQEGADIKDAKSKILDNVDPRKWLCVEVAKEDVIVKNKGDLIILIMVSDQATREKIEKGFDNL